MNEILERKGSSKDIWNTLDDNGDVVGVFFVFSDRVSVFDIGEIPVPFNGLGQLRCAISGKIFKALNTAGFYTHYFSHYIASARMRVQPVNIKALNAQYPIERTDMYTLMPVELLCRLTLTKKFIDRIDSGEIDRLKIERSLPSSDFRDGVRLDPFFVECSTKFEEADRYITDEEAAQLIGTRLKQLHGHYETVRNTFGFLYTFFRSAGFMLMDGKLEAALAGTNNNRSIMLVDSISPDELRLIGPDGRSYDKDPVREWYKDTFPDWYTELLAAKAAFPGDKSKWPTYPDVPPQSVINDMVDRYRTVAEEIGAI